LKLTKELVILDLEATGTWLEKDRIIEVAMIKCAPDGSRKTYQRLINPGIPIPAVVRQLTGIKDDDVAKASKFKDVAQEVIDFIGAADLGGFNIERFDLPLLVRECKDAGLNVNWDKHGIYDAQKIFHVNEKRDLSAAYRYFCGKDMKNAHSALDDTQATLEILEEQVKKYGQDGSLQALQAFQYRKLSEFYDAERRFRWWNGKLYMMFGKYAKKVSLQDIAKSDRGYLEWILASDFSEEVKRLVADALRGRFPAYNAAPQGELFDETAEEN